MVEFFSRDEVSHLRCVCSCGLLPKAAMDTNSVVTAVALVPGLALASLVSICEALGWKTRGCTHQCARPRPRPKRRWYPWAHPGNWLRATDHRC